jgi:hypothetical protein
MARRTVADWATRRSSSYILVQRQILSGQVPSALHGRGNYGWARCFAYLTQGFDLGVGLAPTQPLTIKIAVHAGRSFHTTYSDIDLQRERR